MSVHKIDDDTLLAYADGTLDQSRRTEVTALLNDAPEVQKELERLLRLQRGLRSIFDTADLLPAPNPASWERIRKRIARRQLQRLGLAVGAGICAMMIILVGLALGYGEQSATTAAPTPVSPSTNNVDGVSVPSVNPGSSIIATSNPAQGYPSPAYPSYSAPGAGPIATSVPRWPSLTLISGTLPLGRMAYTEGFSSVGNGMDPCWTIYDAYRLPAQLLDQALSEGSRIFVLNAGDQQPTHVANGCVPVLSPDGQRVAYSSAGDIFVVSSDGSQKTRLTTGPAQDSFPSWSPDGQRIAFARDGEGTRDLYVMNADGSQPIQLMTNPKTIFLPGQHYSWSPDGQKIAFTVEQPDGASIAIADTDGSRLTELPRSSNLNFWPVWSPDGKKIAFLWAICCDPAPAAPIGSRSFGIGDIYVMNADGSEQTQLTREGNGPPVWSPNGSKIAFFSGRDGRGRFQDLYIMNADGWQQTRLVTVGASVVGPLAWSPDGQYVSFTAAEVNLSTLQDWSALAVLKLDGSQLIQLPIKNYEQLTWSQ
jgi:Tol biopolymer transport system component